MKKNFFLLVLLSISLSSISVLANGFGTPGVPQVQGLTFRDNLRTVSSIFTIWEPVPGATEYIHEYSLNGTSDWQVTRILASNGANFTMRGLMPDTEYFVRVKAVVALSTPVTTESISIACVGCVTSTEGPYSAITPMRTLGVPRVQGLTFRDNLRTNTSIFTTWQPVDGATQYIHEYSLTGFSDWQVTRIQASNGTDFTIRGLMPNTQVFVRVKATVGGFDGPYSEVVSMRTRDIPARPTNLTGVSSSGKVTLTWSDNSNSETRFLVFASFNGGASYVAPVVVPASNGSTASFVYGGLPANADIRFYVVAENLDGVSDQSNNILVTTVPNKVQFVSAFATGLNFVGTFWENPNVSPGGFNFQFIQDGGSDWSTVFIPANAGNSFVLSNLQQGTRYLIRVAALNSAGSGDYSDPIAVTTLRRLSPNVPTALKTMPVDDARISASWSLGAEDQVFFTNTRSFGEVQITRDTTLAPTVVRVDKDATTFTFEGLMPQTAYFIRVGSGNEVGARFTSWVVDTTLGKPLVPSELMASADIDAIGDGIVKLSWKDNSNNEDHFTVTIQGGSAPQSVKVIPNTTQFTHTPVEQGVSYAYFISAGNKFGESASTDTIRVTVPFTSVPKAPYGLKATRSGGNVVLTWLDDSNAEESFSIERAPAGTTTFAVVGTVSRNVVTFTNQNVAGNAGFVYRVRAINPVGSSAFSNTSTVTGATGTGFVSGDWAIYPNPTANSLRVDLSELNLTGAYTVRVLDGMNRELLRKAFDASTGTLLDLSSLREGTYTLVVSGEGNRMTKKVVKF